MKSSSQKLFTFLLTIVSFAVSLNLTACGARKSGEGEAPAPVVDSQEPSQTNVGTEPKTEPKDNPAPQPVATVPAEPVVPSEELEVSSPEQQPLEYDPEAIEDNEIAQTGKRYTGAKTPEGLLYTSSSTDGLLAYLRHKNLNVSEAQQKASLRVAAMIVSAKIKNNDFSKSLEADSNIELNLKLQIGSSQEVYRLYGQLSAEAAQPLQVVSVNPTQVVPVKGTIKCVDLKMTCRNIVARLAIGPKDNVGIAYVVFRNGLVDLEGQFSEGASETENPEFLEIFNFVANTADNVSTDKRFDNYYMNTFEVVNGRSGFMVEMKTRHQQYFGFEAPLLAAEAGTVVNLQATKVKSDLEHVKYDQLNTIENVSVINNNGLGKVRLLLKMRAYGEQKPESFRLLFSRKIQSLQPLNEDLLK